MTYTDPDLKYGVAAAQVVGRAVLRVANAPTPPQRFADFSTALIGYFSEIKGLAEKQRKDDEQRDRLIVDQVFGLAGDTKNPVTAPASLAITPHFDFAPLEQAIARLHIVATSYDCTYAARGAALDPPKRQELNGLLRDVDQLLLDDRGLPGRPWYRNLIAAPGRFTGYTAKTLPGVREAIEERRYADAIIFINRTAAAINAYTNRLQRSEKLLAGPMK